MLKNLILLFCLTFFCSSALAQDANPLFVVMVDDKRGFIDKTGKIVIQPQFNGATSFSEGRAVVAVSNPNYNLGYIDEKGKIVIEAKFDDARDFSEGLAAVGIGEFLMHGGGEHKFGFVDKFGKMVIEPKFESAGSFSEGLAPVKNNLGKWGYIDKTGKLIIPYKFDNAFEFSEGLSSVRLKKEWGFINHSGKFVIKPRYTFAGKFSEGLAAVKTGGTLITYEDFSSSSSVKATPEKWMYLDKNGKVVIKLPENVRDAGGFSEGFAVVGIKGEKDYTYYGYINKIGNFVIKPQFSTAQEFSDGLALIILNPNMGFSKEGFGFIDKTGKIVMSFDYPSEFAMVRGFQNGLAWVQKGGEDAVKNFREAGYGYIDKTGKVIWKPTK